MKSYVVRLRRGSDLLQSIEEFCINKSIKAGVVLSGVGCVTKARVRDASGVNIVNIDEHMEIVSLTGIPC